MPKITLVVWLLFFSFLANAQNCPTVGFTYNNFQANGGNTSYTFISNSTVPAGTMSYLWTFGDPSTGANDTSTIVNPLHIFSVLGTYTVTLKVTNNLDGCSTVSTQTVEVPLPVVVVPPPPPAPIDCPVAVFYVSGNTNLGESTTFTNTSSVGSGSLVYSWNFGDAGSGSNNTSSLDNPTHIFSGVGNFITTLIATNSVTGCKDSISKTVTIGTSVVVVPPTPTPPTVVCPVVDFKSIANTNSGDNFTFISTSTISAGDMSYFWDLGNGTTSTLINPSVLYASPASRTVKLVVTSSTGCADSTSKVITYCAKTTANFGVTSNGVCANNNSFVFANTSSNTAGSSATTYAWSFGDGTFSTSATPAAKVYAVAGEYTVKLVATLNNNGCTSIDSTTQIVSVNPVPVPVYVLYLDTELTSIDQMKRCFRPGYDFSFISNSTITKGEMNYKWTFGTTDFSFRDPGDTKVNARMIFNKAGTFPVKLVVTSDKGCTDSITRNAYLAKPISNFTPVLIADALGDIRRPSISFNNNSHDVGASAYLTSKWTSAFGIVETTTTYLPIVPTVFTPTPNKFDKGGTYTTSLRVTNDFGCTNSSSENFTFYVRPEAKFTLAANTPNVAGLPIVTVATNTSSLDETPVNLTYAWNFGDGSAIETTNIPAAHLYPIPGVKTITLTVTNTNGGLVSTTVTNVGAYATPFSAFTLGTTTVSSTGLPIVSVATNTSYVNETPVSLSYAWNFGDGSAIETTAIPTPHAYTTRGTKTITLTVTNNHGGLVSVTTRNVTVYITPIAAFTLGTTTASSTGLPIVNVASNESTVAEIPASLTYAWNFGDGSAIETTAVPAAHTYATRGTKTITLTVTNSNGGFVSTTTRNVTVYITPIAAFTLGATTTSSTGLPIVNVASNGSTVAEIPASLTYAWNFGDGSTIETTTVPAAHTYATGGTKTITLTVTNSNGGLVSVTTRNAIISVTPIAAFTLGTTTASSTGLPIVNVASNGSTVAEIPASLTYAWNFGDGSTIETTSIPAAHTYTTRGTKTITLTVTNSNGGLVSTTTRNVTVYITPIAAFTLGTTTASSTGLPIVNVASNGSTVAEIPASLTYAWNFGDGSSIETTLIPAAHTYTTEGSKTITLTVTNSNGGLVSTTTRNVSVVFPIPVAKIAAHLTNPNPSLLRIDFNAIHASNPSTVSSGTITGFNWIVTIRRKNNNSITNTSTRSTSSGTVTINRNTFYAVLQLTVTTNLGKQHTTTAQINNASPSGFTTFRSAGTSLTSSPIFDEPSVQLINTIPNPASNSVAFSFNAVSNSSKLQIVDLMGRVVLQQTQSTVSGARNASIVDISSIARGSYLVRITDEIGVVIATSQFLKQ